MNPPLATATTAHAISTPHFVYESRRLTPFDPPVGSTGAGLFTGSASTVRVCTSSDTSAAFRSRGRLGATTPRAGGAPTGFSQPRKSINRNLRYRDSQLSTPDCENFLLPRFSIADVGHWPGHEPEESPGVPGARE